MTECRAGCGVELHPAAVAGGFDQHPGCEPREEAAEYRWGCIPCGTTGTADNAVQAVALEQVHRSHACPATATTMNDPDEANRIRTAQQRGELIGFRPDVSYEARVVRRRALELLYGDEVPAYKRPFRPR